MTFDITLLSAISVFIPLIMGIARVNRLNTVGRLVIIFVIITALLEVIARFFFERSINNLFLFHLHTYIEFVLVAAIVFFDTLNVWFRKLTLTLTAFFLVLSILNLISLEGVREFNSNQRYLEGILLLVLLLPSAFRSNLDGSKNSKFLFLCLSLYFVGTLLVFVLSKELINDKVKNYSWVIHLILNIGLNISFTAFLLRNNRSN